MSSAVGNSQPRHKEKEQMFTAENESAEIRYEREHIYPGYLNYERVRRRRRRTSAPRVHGGRHGPSEHAHRRDARERVEQGNVREEILYSMKCTRYVISARGVYSKATAVRSKDELFATFYILTRGPTGQTWIRTSRPPIMTMGY